jgi:type III pantothenate kinase
LVEHLVFRLSRELTPPVQVIATGGDSQIIAEQTTCFHLIDPWITLDGIRLIGEYEEKKTDSP